MDSTLLRSNGTIRHAGRADAAAICAVYNPYVADSITTFELQPVSTSAMAARIEAVLARMLPWLIYEEGGLVLGYAYAAPWKERPAYRRSVESTVYVSSDGHGRGIGTRLYAALLDELRSRQMHSVMGGIALPNPGSIALHERFGFRKVAHLSQVGWKQDRWVDVGYWQLLLQG